jgi:threonine dehydratase
MPRTAPQAKKDAVRGYGGRVVECEPSTSSREAVFAEVLAETGAEFVHPYNDPRVIAGQATCSAELIEQVDGLDAVVAPIGGGGMISGTCLTLSALAPGIRIYAAEPEQADAASETEIVEAMKLIWKRMKIVMEPSSAVPLATILKHPKTFAGKRVGVIVTGGNVDLDRLPWN